MIREKPRHRIDQREESRQYQDASFQKLIGIVSEKKERQTQGETSPEYQRAPEAQQEVVEGRHADKEQAVRRGQERDFDKADLGENHK